MNFDWSVISMVALFLMMGVLLSALIAVVVFTNLIMKSIKASGEDENDV